MPHDVIIRSCEPADFPSITQIQAEAVLNGLANFDLVPMPIEQISAKLTGLMEQSYPVIVASSGAQVLGYAYAGPYRERPGYRWTVEDSVYVDPAHQNHGVGANLLGELIKRSESLGFQQMIAVIGDSENHGSINLHSKFGFRHTGTMERVGFKLGRWLDVVIMQRGLGDNSTAIPDESAYPGTLFRG